MILKRIYIIEIYPNIIVLNYFHIYLKNNYIQNTE